MSELVSCIRYELKDKSGMDPCIPHWLGEILGHLTNKFASLIGKNLPISAIRLQKFTSNTNSQSNKHTFENFTQAFTLQEGLLSAPECEFKKPDPERDLLYGIARMKMNFH